MDEEKQAGSQHHQDHHGHVPQYHDYRPAEDEISLIDLWLVLVRRRWVIAGITLLCVVLGTGYAWWQPVRYEYKTGMELAMIRGGYSSTDDELNELILSKEEIIALLEDLIIPAQRKKRSEDNETGPRVEVIERGGPGNLVLKSVATPENSIQVEALHKEVVDALKARSRPVFEKRIDVYVQPLRFRKEILQEQMKTHQDQLQRLSSRAYDAKEDGVLGLIDAYQMSDIREKMAKTRLELSDTESEIEVIQEVSRPLRMRFLASQTENPVGAGKAVIVALSLIMGLMLGIFSAFFAEFLAQAKQAQKK